MNEVVEELDETVYPPTPLSRIDDYLMLPPEEAAAAFLAACKMDGEECQLAEAQ